MAPPYQVGDAVCLRAGVERRVVARAGHEAFKHASDGGRSRYDIATAFDLTENDLQDGSIPDGDPPNFQLRRDLAETIVYTDADKGIVVAAEHPNYQVRLYFAMLMNDSDA